MKSATKYFVGVVLLSCIIILVACGGGSSKGGGSTPPPPSSPILNSISVTGTSTSVVVGATLQLKATGTYSDSTTKDLSATATWSSSDQTVATVSTAGLVTGVKAGTTSIKATSGSVNGSVNVSVNAASIASITITPPTSTTVALGDTLQLAATGTFDNGSTGDVTSIVTWASSDDTVMQVDPATGLVTAKAASGTADITASSGSVKSAKLTLSAAAAAPKTLMIVPSTVSLAVLQWMRPSAYLVYTDNSVQDVSRSTSFTVADSNVAVLTSPFLGVLTGESAGTTSIGASYNGMSAQANVTVSGNLTGIAIVANSGKVHPGGELRLQSTATFDTGVTQTPLRAVFWQSSDPTVATFTQGLGGLLTGVAPGTVTATAKSGTLNDTETVTVDDLAYQSFSVAPNTLDLAINVTQQLTATATFSNGSATDEQVLSNVTWASSDETVAKVDDTGLVRSIQPGSAIITATLPGGAQQTVGVTAAHKTFDHIEVVADKTSPKAGDDVQFTAKVFVKEGFSYDITTTSIWFSSDASIALIDAWGKLHALKAGTVTITTVFGHIQTTTLTIGQ